MSPEDMEGKLDADECWEIGTRRLISLHQPPHFLPH